ncbi:MAG: hypothetical protein MUO76_00120 [Anaerolineaceae bacterium]|nr:hypothetical protein [Anaerolineaceae bacterium]
MNKNEVISLDRKPIKNTNLNASKSVAHPATQIDYPEREKIAVAKELQ